ncbi:MAG: polyribonucleotide nucleotidyltransferase [Patescibacteria group bacterium]|nr:polyribonucleotide nucleotidyltransferase [Patescibacteria group bacterium]
MSYPTYGQSKTYQIKVGDKNIELEIGRFSEQIEAAVLVRCGETVVHLTVGLGEEVDWGYFPLHVEYIEKLYASGVIKGSRWVKREGHPSDDAVLKARNIDRTIRPLFPEGIKNQVQVVATIFSYDQENQDDMLALLAAGVALEISSIPFNGPIAGIRIGYSKETGEYVVNPTKSEMQKLDLDLIVCGGTDSIAMVEAGADEVDEEVILGGLAKAQEEFANICKTIKQIKDEIGREKVSLVALLTKEEKDKKEKITQEITANFDQQIKEMIEKKAHLSVGRNDMNDLIESIVSHLNEGVLADDEGFKVKKGGVKEILEKLMKQEARRMILEDKVRPDGRKPDEIRPIWTEVDVFPRTHGSAMFKRGGTQAATITTLASPAKGLHIEDMGGEEVRHYLHHYNMPPYAWGGTGRFGYPKRREVGHGRLAQRALKPMIPDQESFPYTIRVVSEIMSSNGSTSQASVCGSTMSLMAAGVPIKRPVAGIAMGMISDGLDNYQVLYDIQGLEDHSGDMDFKAAGTTEGLTAIQMDIKLPGITIEILREALAKAKDGRLQILDKMLSCIDESRSQISKFAPKIVQVEIPVDKIGEVIGPGGKVIKGIMEETGVEIDVDEDEEREVGMVNISSEDQAAIDRAREIVEGIVKEVQVGEEYQGVVNRIENYGAFVNILPGKDGLVHVSNMANKFVKDPNTIVSMGDRVEVRVVEIKDGGKIGLSMLTEEEEKQQNEDRKKRNSKRNGNSRSNSRNRRDNKRHR